MNHELADREYHAFTRIADAIWSKNVTLKKDASASTDFEGDSVTVGTSAVEMTFTGETKSIHIEADVENSGYIYVGKSNVTNLGANAMSKLEPGASLTIKLNDKNEAVYVVSDIAAQTVYKMALI